jgi:hypothetical protein
MSPIIYSLLLILILEWKITNIDALLIDSRHVQCQQVFRCFSRCAWLQWRSSIVVSFCPSTVNLSCSDSLWCHYPDMRKERGNLVICLGYVHHHYWFKNVHCRFEYSAHSAKQRVQPITMPSLIQHTLTSWFQWLPNPNLYPCCHQWKHIVLLLIYWCVVLKRAKSETTRCHFPIVSLVDCISYKVFDARSNRSPSKLN